MDGLEKITARIIDGANAEAEKIIFEANEQAKKIKEETAETVRVQKEKILSDADVRSMQSVRGADSRANLDGRKRLLASKRKMLDAAFDKAKENLLSLSCDEYFLFIENVIDKIYSGEKCEIVLSKKDFDRINQQFKDFLKNKDIKIADSLGDFDGGFILKYEFLEENCTLSSLLRQKREMLEDAAAKILF